MKYLVILVSSLFIFSCTTTPSFDKAEYKMKKTIKHKDQDAQLIILASNTDEDDYYHEYDDKIFRFHVGFANQILNNGDHVLILTTENKFSKYANALPKEAIIVNLPMQDIWMRDFSLSHTSRPIKFRYSAAGQGGGLQGEVDSDNVQLNLFTELEKAKLNFKTTSLVNDGGNWVDNGIDKVIVSTKFLKDNRLTEAEATKKLKDAFNIDVLFIDADEQGGLEHSDGVVSFIEPNKLLINSYPQDKKYSDYLKSKIKNKFSNVKILELPTPYNGKIIHDSKFGSACGLYTNVLVTKKNIYLPQFSISEDAVVLGMVSKFTSKNVIPVKSESICEMGGGVRCMSWQLAGENKDKLLDYLAR